MDRKTILLIDNDAEEHLIFSLAVRALKTGCELYTAFTAEEAINLLDQFKVDLIFLDVYMPMDGFSCVKMIKQKVTVTGNIPFYFYTGNPNEEIIARARVLNASGVLRKKGDVNLLAGSIDYLLKRPVDAKFGIV